MAAFRLPVASAAEASGVSPPNEGGEGRGRRAEFDLECERQVSLLSLARSLVCSALLCLGCVGLCCAALHCTALFADWRVVMRSGASGVRLAPKRRAERSRMAQLAGSRGRARPKRANQLERPSRVQRAAGLAGRGRSRFAATSGATCSPLARTAPTCAGERASQHSPQHTSARWL